MKQLCMINDTVKHPKAIPRTLYVFASTSSACSRSKEGHDGALRRNWTTYIHQIPPHCQMPIPTHGEKAGEMIARATSYNKHSIHGVHACRHKPRVSVNIFKVILFSSIPR